MNRAIWTYVTQTPGSYRDPATLPSSEFRSCSSLTTSPCTAVRATQADTDTNQPILGLIMKSTQTKSILCEAPNRLHEPVVHLRTQLGCWLADSVSTQTVNTGWMHKADFTLMRLFGARIVNARELRRTPGSMDDYDHNMCQHCCPKAEGDPAINNCGYTHGISDRNHVS